MSVLMCQGLPKRSHSLTPLKIKPPRYVAYGEGASLFLGPITNVALPGQDFIHLGVVRHLDVHWTKVEGGGAAGSSEG
jgi:hypothetical protein